MSKKKKKKTKKTIELMDMDARQIGLNLLDTYDSQEPTRSCIATAVREARALVGRDAATGKAPDDNDHEMTWAGALVWFVFLEQVGQIFSPIDPGTGPEKENEIQKSLRWFGDVDDASAKVLAELRNRFAHDYALAPPEELVSGIPRYRLDDGPDLVLIAGDLRTVSLPQFTETCENVHAQLWEGIAKGEVAVIHPGGLERAFGRFTMTFQE